MQLWRSWKVTLRPQFLLLLMILQAFAGLAQVPVVLSGDSLANKNIALHDDLWRFHPGDDPLWANPGYDDAHWDTLRPNFGNDALPKGWNGYGWFRIQVKKNNLSTIAAWGLYLNHDGASEVYWDGLKVAGIGRFSISEKDWTAQRAPFTILPVAIADTLPHLLAVRYCNYGPAFPDFAGFQLWAGDMHLLNSQRLAEQRFYDRLLLSGSAQAILILLHVLLFTFYPGNRVNGYYSLFVLSSAGAMFSRYLTITATNPYIQAMAYPLFLCSLISLVFTGALLLYSVSYERLPRRRLLVLGGISLALLLYVLLQREHILTRDFNYTIWNRSINTFTIVAFADGIRAIIQGIRRGNKRLWLIASGMFMVGILSVVVGSNVFQWFSFRTVMTVMAFGTLIIPVLFSIYLALGVADTNRHLSVQLDENKVLSAQMLAQEQEKTKLIAGQAEQLEQTVMERTAQVREQAEKLREMDMVKSRFFVNLTHEFRTPLTLIMNPARELLRRSDTEEGKQYARYILQNADRLLQLINQLLDLSKLESGRIEINAEPLELVNWLHASVQQYASLAEQKGTALTFSSNTPELWLETDPDKMLKIVQNLVSNAIKFIDQQGSVTVTLTAETDDRFEISVADTGKGIPQEKLPYIFDRFYQADISDTRTREGAGIGLALVKELTELLGGMISVSSTEDQGTTFTVSFPLLAAVPAGMPQPVVVEESPEPASPPVLFSNAANEELPEVLVVEDNKELRDFIRTSIAGNYSIRTAQDGAEGIRIATEHIPALVITDLMMPEKDGYEVCRVLKTDERTSHIPVIMLTAKTDRSSKIQGIQTGADAYLSKPFDQQELLALMENLMRIRKQLREKYGRDNVWLTDAATMPSIEKKFLERVRHAVETRIADEQYGAEQLGRDVGMSRTQLHRKLKELINQSPGGLVRTVRMQRAYDLLQNGIATVAEVCYMVGYSNPANFSTAFSRHFGFPPSGVLNKKS